eukprot:4262113-Pyramimonas_sp.AAC.1
MLARSAHSAQTLWMGGGGSPGVRGALPLAPRGPASCVRSAAEHRATRGPSKASRTSGRARTRPMG